MDDFMAMLDNDIEAERNAIADLPVAPTTAPSREPPKKESKSTSNRVAELN